MVEREKPHHTALSAWRGLVEAGGLQPEGRDAELVDCLHEALNRDANSLEEALEVTSTETFVDALFRAVEPFPMMFADILRFFELAGAREGQRQWRLVIGEEVFDFKHFEEFEREWWSIECEFDVPTISAHEAFLPNTVRNELEGMEYLLDTRSDFTGQTTGIADADEWLEAYDADEYAPFPRSLLPEGLPTGLDDAARIVMTALHVVGSAGYRRRSLLLEAFRARRGSVSVLGFDDGLHVWTIAQNETDYWMRTMVQFLGRLMAGPESPRARFAAELSARYGMLPRRRLNARVEVQDLVRLLSLPAWRKRPELFAVWVATEIVAAADPHEVRVNHADGELQFAFREARIADIVSARPMLSLFSERKTAFDSPIGKGRKRNVQPDYGLWRDGWHEEECVLVVEVKHYKRSSQQNFRDALIDYARAHLRAEVMLVNYGPVRMSQELPHHVAPRCGTIEQLNPRNKKAKNDFRNAVRKHLGEPARTVRRLAGGDGLPGSVVIDTSASMAHVLQSSWFAEFTRDLARGGAATATLIDDGPRSTVKIGSLADWLQENELGRGTRLAATVEALVQAEGSALVVTDSDGLQDLKSLYATTRRLDEGEDIGAKVLELRRRETSV